MQHGKDASAVLPLPARVEEIDIGPVQQASLIQPVQIRGQQFFRVSDEIGIKVFSATCPHMGGEVRHIGDCFECPLHGWTFDLQTGSSLNAAGAALSEIQTTVRNGRLLAQIPVSSDVSVDTEAHAPRKTAPADLSIKLVAHSSLEIARGAFTLLTDPWLSGPAMLGAWIQSPPPVTRAVDHHPGAIWISHEHSDHFHEPTLMEFDRKTPIYFPDFPNRRIPRRLAVSGFTNLHAMPFGEQIALAPGIDITCYEPASLWNDSIVLIEVDGYRILNLNDAGLNRRIAQIIGPVDLVASAFTPGASGYPLTWSHLLAIEQDAILSRSCQGMLQMLREAVRLYGCESLLPYAGHFALWHPLHRDYMNRMKKNTLADVKTALADLPVDVIDLLPGDNWAPADREFQRVASRRERDPFDPSVFAQHHGLSTTAITVAELDEHFLRLNDVPEIIFCEELKVDVMATDISLKQTHFARRYDIQGGRVAVGKDDSHAHLTMRVPITVLTRIIRDDLSWDESHIGYWCGFSRSPDIFHGGFWRLLQSPYYRRSPGSLPVSIDQMITDQTAISSLIEKHGQSAERILRRYGMYCGGCHRAASETITQAATMHGIDMIQRGRLLQELNSALTHE